MLLSRRTMLKASALSVAGMSLPCPTLAAGPDPKALARIIGKATTGLTALQNADGSFNPRQAGPGVTALVTTGLLRTGTAVDAPVVAKALGYLEKSIRPDGGIYAERLANYTTSVALMTFEAANVGGKYATVLANGAKFLKGLQKADESLDDPMSGGVGYDGRGRPDLSNTHFFLDALMAAGVTKDDPAVKRAVAFVGNCQNLKGEFNRQGWVEKTTDDDKCGLVYTPADAANAKSQNRTPAGGLRSVGSMTYAGLKSFLYAGLSKDDPRVMAAIGWVRRHYSVEENPGQGQAGLYYYYHLFAKALAALGETEFVDAAGKKHDWRAELTAALAKRQRDDGTWINANRAFLENAPELATAFSLLALTYCKS